MKVKSARREICTYCVQEVPMAECSSDHVVAESWYAKSADAMERWKVRACTKCNHGFGKVERDVVTRLAMCLDPENAAYEDIIARAKRAMDPAFGKNLRDAQSRLALKRKIIAEMAEIDDFNAPGVLPFFEKNYKAGGRHVALFREEWMEALARKWARGIYRIRFNELLPVNAEIDWYFLRKDAEWDVFGELEQIAEPMDRGPDLEVSLLRGRNADREAMIASFHLWQEFKMHCAVTVDGSAAPRPAAIVA